MLIREPLKNSRVAAALAFRDAPPERRASERAQRRRGSARSAVASPAPEAPGPRLRAARAWREVRRSLSLDSFRGTAARRGKGGGMERNDVAVIVGAGPGLGCALGRRF